MNNNNGSIDFVARLKLEQVEKDLLKLQNKFKETAEEASKESMRMERALNNVTKGIVAFFSINQAQQFVADIVRVRSEFQKTEITFGTMLKSKEKANTLISEMVDLAAKTPFGLQDVNEGARRLLAFQVPAEEVTDTLRRMGDVAAGLGVPMGQLIHVYGQVKAQGRLMTNDLYQFMNAGIPIIAELSKITGKAQAEVKEMVSQGKIGFAEIQQVFRGMTDAGGLFHNMNEELSKSLKGQISNLRDNIESMFNELGKSSEGFFSGAISGVNFLVENYKNIGKILSVLVATYGTYKTALMAQVAVQQIVTRYGQYDVVTKQLQIRATIQAMLAQIKLNSAILANPYVLAGAALAGLVVAVWQFSDGMNQAERQQKKFNEELSRLNDTLDKKKQKYSELVAELENENTTEIRKIELFEQLKDQFPYISKIYNNHIQLIKDKTNAQKALNEEIEREKQAFVASGYKQNSGRIERLKKEVAYLESKGDDASYLEKKKLAQYKKTLDALLPFERKFQEQIFNEKKATINKLSIEEQKAYQKRIQEHAQGKVKHQEFEGLEIGKVWSLNQVINDNIKAEEARNKAIDNRIQLQKEVAELDKKINTIQSQKSQSQSDKDNLKKWKEEKEQKEKILQNDYGIKKEKSTKQASTPEFDHEKHQRERARKEQDNLFRQEEARINIMEEGFEKRQAVLQLEYDKREEEIRRRSEDELAYFIETEKQKAEAEGKWKKGQIFNTNTPEINAERAKQQAIQDVLLKSNAENFNKQQTKLLEDLLKKYQTYEEKKAEIAKEFDEEIAELQKKNIDGIYDKNISEAEKKKAEALLQLETSSFDANTAISNLFGDMSKKSIADLEALQKAGEEAFERLKASGILSVEALKAIENKLRSNKELIRSLSPLFKQLSTDFKTLSNKNASIEKKDRAFQGISQNIHKSTQALTQFGDVLNSLGSNTLSEIANTLSEITGRATGVASTLKSLGVGGGLSLGIGAGVGILTSIAQSISNYERKNQEEINKLATSKIQQQRIYNQLLFEQKMLMKDSVTIFGAKEISRAVNYMEQYRHKNEEIQKKLRDGALNNIKIYDRYISHNWVQNVGKKIANGIASLFGGGSDKGTSRKVYASILSKNQELIDSYGRLNLAKAEALMQSVEFENNDDKQRLQELIDLEKQAQKAYEELDKYLGSTFGQLGGDLMSGIVSSLREGKDAFVEFGKSAGKVLENLQKQMLFEVHFADHFKKYQSQITDIYKKGGSSKDISKQVTDLTADFVQSMKGNVESASRDFKIFQDELQKKGLYDETATRQAQIKGVASMTQDQASELNSKFTLGIELDRVRNVSLENITKNIADTYKFLQDVSAKQLKHLAGIEVNTFVLHQMSKDMSSMKQSFDEIKLHGLKMK